MGYRVSEHFMIYIKQHLLPFCAVFLSLALIGLSLLLLFGRKDCEPLQNPHLQAMADIAEINDAAIDEFEFSPEMRAVWIATVGNINFPSKNTLGADELKKEIDMIVSNSASLGFNAIFFQIRPASDALYNSHIFPASSFLVKNQGDVPPLDVLDYLVNAAHSKNIEVYGWINPLRVTYYGDDGLSSLSADNPALSGKYRVTKYADGMYYYDAGDENVRQLIASGVCEVAQNYDVDGIVFDDYFYPYPKYDPTGTPIEFDDEETYLKFSNGEDLYTWRRNNVNSLISECYHALKNVDAECEFGVSPFGVWKNISSDINGSKTNGMEAYDTIFCDALAWIKEGTVDFLMPQLYWDRENSNCPYEELLSWWNTATENTNVKLYVSQAAYKYNDFKNDEISAQIGISRCKSNYFGSALYGYAYIISDPDLKQDINCAYSKAVTYYK